MSDKFRQTRDLAREMLRGSIIEDAAAQFLAQVVQHIHESEIAPLKAERDRLRQSGDYHDGIEEGWKAGEAQERRIWEEAVRLSLGTIPDGLANALVEVRKGVEGDD